MWVQLVKAYVHFVRIGAQFYAAYNCFDLMNVLTHNLAFSTFAALVMLSVGLALCELPRSRRASLRTKCQMILLAILIVTVEALAALFLWEQSTVIPMPNGCHLSPTQQYFSIFIFLMIFEVAAHTLPENAHEIVVSLDRVVCLRPDEFLTIEFLSPESRRVVLTLRPTDRNMRAILLGPDRTVLRDYGRVEQKIKEILPPQAGPYHLFLQNRWAWFFKSSVHVRVEQISTPDLRA